MASIPIAAPLFYQKQWSYTELATPQNAKLAVAFIDLTPKRMLSTYGSIVNQFATSTATIAAASGGTTTTGGSYDFFVQGRNRAGRNLLSSAIAE